MKLDEMMTDEMTDEGLAVPDEPTLAGHYLFLVTGSGLLALGAWLYAALPPWWSGLSTGLLGLAAAASFYFAHDELSWHDDALRRASARHRAEAGSDVSLRRETLAGRADKSAQRGDEDAKGEYWA